MKTDEELKAEKKNAKGKKGDDKKKDEKPADKKPAPEAKKAGGNKVFDDLEKKLAKQ